VFCHLVNGFNIHIQKLATLPQNQSPILNGGVFHKTTGMKRYHIQTGISSVGSDAYIRKHTIANRYIPM
jgi:hypothetical protein